MISKILSDIRGGTKNPNPLGLENSSGREETPTPEAWSLTKKVKKINPSKNNITTVKTCVQQIQINEITFSQIYKLNIIN